MRNNFKSVKINCEIIKKVKKELSKYIYIYVWFKSWNRWSDRRRTYCCDLDLDDLDFGSIQQSVRGLKCAYERIKELGQVQFYLLSITLNLFTICNFHCVPHWVLT